MKHKLLLFIAPVLMVLLGPALSVSAQSLPVARRTSWGNPGSRPAFTPLKTVLLSQFGADVTGVLPADSALAQAIRSLNGPGRVLMPKGRLLFNAPIVLPDSLILEGTDDTATPGPDTKLLLRPGLVNSGIMITGALTPGVTTAVPCTKGDTTLRVASSTFTAGEYLLLSPHYDSTLVNNSWAQRTTGQIVRIVSVSANLLSIDKPIRRSYPSNEWLEVIPMQPRRQVHLKCFAIERLDSTQDQTSNIYFEAAVDCSVSGISSRKCNYAHIDVWRSKNITVEASDFREGFSYGSGGKAYGIMLQATTSDCYVHLNHFEHLRHSMILQSGANGNVLAYNHSVDPFWSDPFLPADAAGDVVLHGNYVYQNLIEGNAIQNAVIDNSHGKNGPFNTFFRNKMSNWGLFMNTAPPSDSQNFINNLITSTTPFRGLYSLQGNGHFEWGNGVKTVVQPAGTGEWPQASLFGYGQRAFYQTVSSFPPFTLAGSPRSQEAMYRAEVLARPSSCGEILYPAGVFKNTLLQPLSCFPNPTTGLLQVTGANLVGEILVLTDMLGTKIREHRMLKATETLDLHALPAGLYLLHTRGAVQKILKH